MTIDTIKIFEDLERLMPDDRELKMQTATLRALIPMYEKQERELWEEQPGGITAPAPRPKGTPLPPPLRVRD